MKRMARLCTAVFVGLIGTASLSAVPATDSAWASGSANLSYLGKYVDVTSPASYFPLSGFHKITTPVSGKGKAELMFLGTLAAAGQYGPAGALDELSANGRWPVVKALDQFGVFANLKQDLQTCVVPPAVSPSGGAGFCMPPTFDWSHASYRSKYVVFDHKDLLDRAGHRYQKMTGIEKALYYRYVRISQPISYPRIPTSDRPDDILLTVALGYLGIATTRGFPLVAIGRYVQTVSQDVNVGVYQQVQNSTVHVGPGTPQPTYMANLSFDAVRDALVRSREPYSTSQLVLDVNGEANIMTALICHADGGKPSSVCRRGAISRILRSVK